ncbi:hypothetical protein [Kytococcus sp. HMSC28H12]|uniref:hypothetical protein n=1 Tax=Kytococcus sp. HMSC28H12 TaxID=1581067 RepID=UPI0008A35D49|nr:hypothetical protein [Kytococcus sp. HMSC28H12]OFS06520.1 hypothetical protein HMPREF3099_11025 [Kytococcus sp. HMSC28H12]
MKRAGQVLVVLGVLGVIAAVVLGVMGLVGAGRAVNAVEGGQKVGSGITRELHAGDGHLLTHPLDTGSSATCTVQGPDGDPVSTSPSDDQVDLAKDFVDLVGGITVTTDGPHTVRCTDPDVRLTDPVSMASLGLAALGLVGAVPVGLGAGLALVLGIILWVAGTNRANRPHHPGGPYGGYGGGGYGGGYGQPGQNPPYVQPTPQGGYTVNGQPTSTPYGQPGPGQPTPPSHRAPWE